MIFAWDERNRDHIDKHNVSPSEAEEVVRNATAPYPAEIGGDKLAVWGQTRTGRYLQVIYVLKTPDEVAYESLSKTEWEAVASDDDSEIIGVIHAMELTPTMKKRLRKRRP